MATIRDYLKNVESLQLKQLVYKELIAVLLKYTKSDYGPAEFYIPISAEAFLGEDIDVSKTVPEDNIEEVSKDLQKTIDKLQDEINKLLNKELK